MDFVRKMREFLAHGDAASLQSNRAALRELVDTYARQNASLSLDVAKYKTRSLVLLGATSLRLATALTKSTCI